MITILVTGANGQLGNEIRKLSINFKHFEFVFTDVEDLDITNISDIRTFFSVHEIHYIINCAAYTNVDKAESDIENAEKINAFAVKNLAEISKQNKIPLIHISTDYVFDGESAVPYTENDLPEPQSVYGMTKLKGEEFAKTAFSYLIIRTSWLYSSFGNNFVKTMLRFGKERDEIHVVSDQTGSPTYAEDLAAAILKILQDTSGGLVEFQSGIYNFSNEGACSWYEFAQEIMHLAHLDCIVKPILTKDYPTSAKRPKYSLLDKTKIKETFGVKIPFWKDSLDKCLNRIFETEKE